MPWYGVRKNSIFTINRSELIRSIGGQRFGVAIGGADSQAQGKSIWWMPRHVQAMKDVARCDKRR
jgi:hypothetical protein